MANPLLSSRTETGHSPSDELAAGHMTFWEHLQELRVRLIRMVLGFLVGAAVAWYFKETLLVILTKPYVDGWSSEGTRPSLHFSDPAGLFVSYVKISMLGGFVLSLPLQLYQIWAFIAPGLYAKEKWLAVPFVLLSCVLFCTGAFFGWKFVFPVAFEYLLQYAEIPLGSALEVHPTVMIESYLSFITQALLAFGVVFEIPVVVFFLAFIGVVDHTHLIKFFRYFIVIAFIVAAVITPPDPLSQLLLAAPLIGLYVISIGIAWFITKAKRRNRAAP
jgi:sec-independent protein translocase protein TatC